jgi:hypothetical protein
MKRFCFCFDKKTKKSDTNQNITKTIFSQIEYDKTIDKAHQLKQKLLGKRVRNMETYYLTNAT